jgi:glycosyltransferase involved in cell wall biosynthesis
VTPPVLSVVIPTFNRRAVLVRCLQSLSRQNYPADRAEIVVVDDGSDTPPDEAELEAAVAPHTVRLVRIPHGGAGAARARGVVEVRGALVAFLDDDCSVPPDYFTAVEAAFADLSVEVVQVGLENPEPDNLYGRAWERVWKMAVAASSELAPDGRVHVRLLGGVMAARRSLFERVRFEPTLEAREDIDLRLQLQALGIPIVYDPRITVFNHCRRTLGDYLRQQAWYGRSEAALRRKWGPLPGGSGFNPTSYQALRAALREEGWKDGLAIHAILRLKRHAGLAGFLQQQARDRAGSDGWPYRVEWMRGVVTWYARNLVGAARRAVRRPFTGSRATPSR